MNSTKIEFLQIHLLPFTGRQVFLYTESSAPALPAAPAAACSAGSPLHSFSKMTVLYIQNSIKL